MDGSKMYIEIEKTKHWYKLKIGYIGSSFTTEIDDIHELLDLSIELKKVNKEIDELISLEIKNEK